MVRPHVVEEHGPLLIHDEEVPREGLTLRRAFQLARWADGSSHLWTTRLKQPIVLAEQPLRTTFACSACSAVLVVFQGGLSAGLKEREGLFLAPPNDGLTGSPRVTRRGPGTRVPWLAIRSSP